MVALARLLLLMLPSATASADAFVPHGPRFSWDTLPVFIHTSNASGPISAAGLATMARFPMVTVEKFQGPCGNAKTVSPACDQEDQIIAPLKQLKAMNQNISTIFYYNSVLDFPQYKLHTTMLADPSLMLHDSNGEVVKMGCPSPLGKCDVFDFANPKARALFIEECVNATQTGFVDGCFCDRAVDGTPTDSGDDRVPCSGADCRFKLNLSTAAAKAYAMGHVKVLTDLQTALGDGPVVANHAYGPPHDNMVPGSVSFSMIEGFGPNNQSINQLLTNAANGRGVQAHGKPTESCVAAFLIGAGHRAFFGVGGWSEKQSRDFSDHWMPQFGLPLGAPHGDAVYNAATQTWARAFGPAPGEQTAVEVTFHVANNTGVVSGWTLPWRPDNGGGGGHGGPGPAPPPTKSCPGIRAGGYSNDDVGKTTAASWSQCCADCTNTEGCVKWTWGVENKPEYCHLHGSMAKANNGGHDGRRVSGSVAPHF